MITVLQIEKEKDKLIEYLYSNESINPVSIHSSKYYNLIYESNHNQLGLDYNQLIDGKINFNPREKEIYLLEIEVDNRLEFSNLFNISKLKDFIKSNDDKVIKKTNLKIVKEFLNDYQNEDLLIITNCEPNYIDMKIRRMEYLEHETYKLNNKINLTEEELDSLESMNKEYYDIQTIANNLIDNRFMFIIKSKGGNK